MSERFFIAHIFFLVAFVALIGAFTVVLKNQRKQWKPLLLAFLPLALIFVTAQLGKNAPEFHRIFNIFYNGLLIYNAYFFWKTAQPITFGFYLAAILATALDFAMHFVFRAT